MNARIGVRIRYTDKLMKYPIEYVYENVQHLRLCKECGFETMGDVIENFGEIGNLAKDVKYIGARKIKDFKAKTHSFLLANGFVTNHYIKEIEEEK